jgi:carbonic anhydrase/acetyltransferase-like protein (isoleucine patch superfamily)
LEHLSLRIIDEEKGRKNIKPGFEISIGHLNHLEGMELGRGVIVGTGAAVYSYSLQKEMTASA